MGFLVWGQRLSPALVGSGGLALVAGGAALLIGDPDADVLYLAAITAGPGLLMVVCALLALAGQRSNRTVASE